MRWVFDFFELFAGTQYDCVVKSCTDSGTCEYLSPCFDVPL